MSASVKDIDRGWAAMIKRVFADGAKIKIDVGIFGPNADMIHDGTTLNKAGQTKQGTKPSSLTVLQVGIFNEFGLGVPERSFIRAYFDTNGSRLRDMATKLMGSVIDGKRTREQIAEILGQRMVGEIQKFIAMGIAPPNAPSTIAAKGSSKPLIDTGQLRASITYKVSKG